MIPTDKIRFTKAATKVSLQKLTQVWLTDVELEALRWALDEARQANNALNSWQDQDHKKLKVVLQLQKALGGLP